MPPPDLELLGVVLATRLRQRGQPGVPREVEEEGSREPVPTGCRRGSVRCPGVAPWLRKAEVAGRRGEDSWGPSLPGCGAQSYRGPRGLIAVLRGEASARRGSAGGPAGPQGAAPVRRCGGRGRILCRAEAIILRFEVDGDEAGTSSTLVERAEAGIALVGRRTRPPRDAAPSARFGGFTRAMLLSDCPPEGNSRGAPFAPLPHLVLPALGYTDDFGVD